MPKQEKSRLDRELEEILAKKAKDRPREPIPFSSHPNAPKSKGATFANNIREILSDIWYPLTRMPLLMAFVFTILVRLTSGFSPLLATLLTAGVVWSLWWPGLKRLGGARDSDEPEVKYWRGKAYTTAAKDAVSRHPVDSVKRFFDRRR